MVVTDVFDPEAVLPTPAAQPRARTGELHGRGRDGERDMPHPVTDLSDIRVRSRNTGEAPVPRASSQPVTGPCLRGVPSPGKPS